MSDIWSTGLRLVVLVFVIVVWAQGALAGCVSASAGVVLILVGGTTAPSGVRYFTLRLG